MNSIRSFLITNLIIGSTIVTSVAIIANLFLAHKIFQENLDSQLSLTACTIEAFLDMEKMSKSPSQAQKKIENVSMLIEDLHWQKNAYLHTILKSIQFQIWDKKHKLVLHSNSAPPIPFKERKSGFGNIHNANNSWRTFTLYNPDNKYQIVLIQSNETRNKLERQSIKHSLIIMLLSYPLLGLVIWYIVGRSLESLYRITKEIRCRQHNYLHPLNIDKVPTEIQPMVHELNNLLEHLENTFEREKRFAGDAAHELRTPLAGLNAQAQIALNAKTEAESIKAIKKILISVKRSTHVVHQLLTLSRMLSDTTTDELTDVDLKEACVEMIANLAPEAVKKHSNIELIAPPHPVEIKANLISISILLRNLIDNAIRYTPENSKIKVIIEQNISTGTTLKVIDDGPGIPEELRERVFERFFRILGTETSGSGLGMGIVHQIIKLCNAKIELRTPDSGKGLEVRIYFP